jgi:hypothetical protein
MGQGTGCRFATHLAGTAKLTYYVVLSSALAKTDLPTIDAVIDEAAKGGQPAAILFPRLRSPAAIVAMLSVLRSGNRWSVDRVPWRNHERRNAVLVRVQWTTAGGLRSSVGGFAPVGTMPATRRSPYVALVLWGGGKANPHKRTPRAGEVGFIDINTGWTAKQHEKAWTPTDKQVRDALADPAEDVERLRGVAFCLPRAAFPPPPKGTQVDLERFKKDVRKMVFNKKA